MSDVFDKIKRQKYRRESLKIKAKVGDRVYLAHVSPDSPPDKYEVLEETPRGYFLRRLSDGKEMSWPGSVTKVLPAERVRGMKKRREKEKIYQALERGGGYTIGPLDEREFETLAWLADHGYNAGIYDGSAKSYDDEGNVTLRIPEFKAWEIKEAVDEDPHAFLANSASRGLNEMLLKFIDEIV